MFLCTIALPSGPVIRDMLVGARFRAARSTLLRTWMPLLIFAGCGPPDVMDLPAQVRDSAGVQILQTEFHRGSDWAPSQWQVEATPTLEIGTVSGEVPYQFGSVRDILPLRDSRIAVLDGSADEIRLFDSNGQFSRAVGRQGDGPGEFRDPFNLYAYRGDSLAVWDDWLRRLSIFDHDLNFVRSLLIDSPSEAAEGWVNRRPEFLGVFSDGSMAVGFPAMRAGSEATVQSESGPVVRLSPTGNREDTLGHFSFKQWYVAPPSQGITLPPFPHWTFFAIHKDHVYIAPAYADEIRVYDMNGTVERIIRNVSPLSELTDEDIRFWKSYRLKRSANNTGATARKALQDQLDATPFPERMPAHWELLVDELGNLWLETAATRPDVPPEWLVFDGTGRQIAALRPPQELDIVRIGSDQVLGVVTDELGVHYVRTHRLMKH